MAMARRIKDATLDSKQARRKLKARGKPYYRQIERGLHLGYRKLRDGAGTWVARHYTGSQSYEVERIGAADDLSDSDGLAILDYWQAQAKARERMSERTHTAAGKSKAPLTVADAMDSYLEFLESNRKTAVDARYRDKAHIRPKLGDIEVAALTAEQIRRWHTDLAKSPALLRTRKGEKQRHRKPGGDGEDSRRRRMASANRVLTTLKASLNMAWREKPKQVPTNAEWSRVEPFENVDVARIRYLDVAEAKRLINASDPDFRQLVQAALQTGARYGELIGLAVADFNNDSGTIAIRQSKAGKPRHVVLTDEGVAFFKQLCAGRAGNEPIFRKASGAAWSKSHQKRPMVAACAVATIKPPIGFHGLRHTWASLAVMAGVPLLVVAKNLGHTDTRMVEKHYGHMAPSYIADAIRKGAPRFGFKPDKKLVTVTAR
jgi:integrase